MSTSFVAAQVLCCESDSGECAWDIVNVDIPTSTSVKWESGPECPSSDFGHDLQCYSYW